jgi:hypothetical protein
MSPIGCLIRGISVGIVKGYGLKDPGVRIPAVATGISLLLNVQTGPGAQPASYSTVNEYLSLRQIG